MGHQKTFIPTETWIPILSLPSSHSSDSLPTLGYGPVINLSPPKRRNPDDKGGIKTYFSFSSQSLLFLYTTHKGLSRRRRLQNFLGGEKGGKGREDGSTQNSIWRHHLSDRKRKKRKGEIFAFAYVVGGERTSIGRSPFFLIFRQV